MNLKGKKLLLMGGAAFSQDIRKYADEQGFTLIGVGAETDRLATFADETYRIDTQDVDTLESIVHKTGANGIFVGTTEANIKPAIELSKRTGIHFYVNGEQWKTLSDKRLFKELLNRYGIDTIPEYHIDANFNEVDIQNIEFPVLVKPADASGARGISVANCITELRESYEYAQSYSSSGGVIVEKFLQGMTDCFIRYHFQNGIYSISSSFDRHCNFSQGGFGGIGIKYTHPSVYLDAYIEKYDKRMQQAFLSLDLKNGVITLQCFVDKDSSFYFYEAGYRLGGSQSYIFTDRVSKSNSLHYMINYALTGEMADYSIAERDNPHFRIPCCNLYIALKPGTITILEGIDEVRNMPEVLNITVMSGVDTVIERTGSLNQVCMRMHIIGTSNDELDHIIERIYNTLIILDEKGENMILEKSKHQIMAIGGGV